MIKFIIYTLGTSIIVVVCILGLYALIRDIYSFLTSGSITGDIVVAAICIGLSVYITIKLYADN